MTDITKILHSGREPFEHNNTINSPIYSSSSLVFKTVEDLRNAETVYGRHGTQTVRYLEDLVKIIENGKYSLLFPSGLSAITTTILGCLSPNDHLLISSSSYDPSKDFVKELLTKFNVEYDFYPAGMDAKIEEYIKPNTKAIFIESPASQTFEIDEIDEIIKICKERNLTSIFDNTFSAGYFLKPLDHGVDVIIQSCSKFFSGHSDIIMGSIATNNKDIYDKVLEHYRLLGLHVSPRDCYLVQRGMRTLNVRLDKHNDNGLKVASWIEKQPLVKEIFYPALPSSKYHDRFKKYFTGCPGLFSFYFNEDISYQQAEKFINQLNYFHIGYGWGGYESLAMIYKNISDRQTNNPNKYLIRLYVGLEDPNDLIKDIENSLNSL